MAIVEEATDFAFAKHPQEIKKPALVSPTPIEPPTPALAPPPSARVEIGTLGTGAALTLDVEKLLQTRALIQASSGGGKSWLIRKILEESYDRTLQIVLDPEGEFGSLVEEFDYDLARPSRVDQVRAKELGVAALKSGRSLIVDLYELEQADRALFVKYVVEGLMDAPKEAWRSCLVVVDEAHLFIPDKVTKLPSARPLIDLASRGRKRGYSCLLATQRLSKLHKDVAAECLNKLIGRTSLERDLRRAGDELGLRGPRANRLRSLKPGQFFVHGPALIDQTEIATIGSVRTKHCAKAEAKKNLEVEDEIEEAVDRGEQRPKRLGRPKGSKNKPKAAPPPPPRSDWCLRPRHQSRRHWGTWTLRQTSPNSKCSLVSRAM